MALVRFENVSKNFERQAGGLGAIFGAGSSRPEQPVTAVEALNALIEDEEFFTIVGPSGCGKSTVLNLVAGLESPSAGEIYFDREPVSGLEPGRRDVAMVFQSYALYPHMNVFENIAFPLRIRRRGSAEISAAVDGVSRALGIEPLLQRRPRELSGGQRQRVALARAMVRRPRVFLMDEPLSNLDARLRIEMRAEIRRLHQRWRVTTIYVTHDQEEAMTLSDRIMVFNAGRVEQLGSPAEIFARPASLFVARFIGSRPMNIFPAEILAGAGFEKMPGSAGAPLVCGVRAADISCGSAPAGAAGEWLELSGVVEQVEDQGDEKWVDLSVAGIRLRARLGGAPLPGQKQIRVYLPRGRIHFFDAGSGMRISSPS